MQPAAVDSLVVASYGQGLQQVAASGAALAVGTAPATPPSAGVQGGAVPVGQLPVSPKADAGSPEMMLVSLLRSQVVQHRLTTLRYSL